MAWAQSKQGEVAYQPEGIPPRTAAVSEGPAAACPGAKWALSLQARGRRLLTRPAVGWHGRSLNKERWHTQPEGIPPRTAAVSEGPAAACPGAKRALSLQARGRRLLTRPAVGLHGRSLNKERWHTQPEGIPPRTAAVSEGPAAA